MNQRAREKTRYWRHVLGDAVAQRDQEFFWIFEELKAEAERRLRRRMHLPPKQGQSDYDDYERSGDARAEQLLKEG